MGVEERRGASERDGTVWQWKSKERTVGAPEPQGRERRDMVLKVKRLEVGNDERINTEVTGMKKKRVGGGEVWGRRRSRRRVGGQRARRRRSRALSPSR